MALMRSAERFGGAGEATSGPDVVARLAELLDVASRNLSKLRKDGGQGREGKARQG